MPGAIPDEDIPRAAKGELLPRAAEAVGVRVKLAEYSLNLTHNDGRHGS